MMSEELNLEWLKASPYWKQTGDEDIELSEAAEAACRLAFDASTVLARVHRPPGPTLYSQLLKPFDSVAESVVRLWQAHYDFKKFKMGHLAAIDRVAERLPKSPEGVALSALMGSNMHEAVSKISRLIATHVDTACTARELLTIADVDKNWRFITEGFLDSLPEFPFRQIAFILAQEYRDTRSTERVSSPTAVELFNRKELCRLTRIKKGMLYKWPNKPAPVVKHRGRRGELFLYEDAKRWLMGSPIALPETAEEARKILAAMQPLG